MQPHQGGQGPQPRPTATHPAQRLADLSVTQSCDQAHMSTLAPIFQVGRLRPDLSSGGDLITISLKPRPTCWHPINSALQVCPGCAPFSPLSKLPSALPATCQQPPNWPLICPPCGGCGDSMKSPSSPGPSRGSYMVQAKAQVLTLLGPPPGPTSTALQSRTQPPRPSSVSCLRAFAHAPLQSVSSVTCTATPF